MADYHATSRTSTFKVKDDEAFKSWLEDIEDVYLLTEKHPEHGVVHTMHFDNYFGVIPRENIQEDEDFCIFEGIQHHLYDGWAVTFMEVGNERSRYLCGFAAVVSQTTIEIIELNQWANKARSGYISTYCEN